MIIATAELESEAPYSQSKHHSTPRGGDGREAFRDYEARTWRERLHVNPEGYVFIPPMAFKNCLAEAAAFLGMKVPGKRNATYTKHFEAGVLVVHGPTLPVKKEDVQGEWLFLPADGKRGGNTRVDKCYPVIPHWKATVEFYIIDEVITREAFEYHLRQAGQFVGIGRFRPRKNGYYGRFKVNKLNWAPQTD